MPGARRMTKSGRHAPGGAYSSLSSSSSLSGSPKCSTWPDRCPGKTQWGPLASIETSATSQGRARYATATQPHGSPSSASSSKTVPVGLTELIDAAGTDISLPPSLASRQTAPDLPTLPAIPGPAIGLDQLSVPLVPFSREVDEKKEVGTNAPLNGPGGRTDACGRHAQCRACCRSELSSETAQYLGLRALARAHVPDRHMADGKGKCRLHCVQIHEAMRSAGWGRPVDCFAWVSCSARKEEAK
jgi:hypothetical protein